MKQDEKLDLIIQKVTELDAKVTSLEEEMTIMNGKITNTDNHLMRLEQKVDQGFAECKASDHAILDEVERVHHILMDHKADLSMHTVV